jgi:glutamate/tyrosine decarboxylase-like PLP-dependent enzyme
MSTEEDGLSDFDERLLQGLFARVWRHLGDSKDSTSKVTQAKTTEEMKNQLDLAVTRQGVDVEMILNDIDTYLSESVNTSHPHFMNPLWGGTNIPAFAGEILAALTNTSMYTFEIAPIATIIENEMITTMSKLVGFDAGEGIFTTGGSNGNLMGLLCARDRKFPAAQQEGLQGKQLIAFVSEDAHYSMAMAANVIGIGMNNLISIQTDEHGRMIPELLEESIAAEKRAGNLPFCVVATAGTTVRGAIDPLNELAEICQSEYLWLHVDAAWGGATLLSPKTRHLLSGIEKADSVCWDPHKMMGMPLICSVFLAKDMGTLNKLSTHTNNAHYLLLDENKNNDLGRKSLQCGRRVDALKLWLAWRAKGDSGWANLIERYFSLANTLASKVEEQPLLQLVVEPSLTNVCIRYSGNNIREETQDEVTKKIRAQLISTGQFMISLSTIQNRPVIRAVIANPRVNEQVIEELVSQIALVGSSIVYSR